MAEASIPAKQLDDMTECPICTEVYVDPRILPCIHTYCLKCIDGWCRDKQPDAIHCPLCRKQFTIPPGGVTDLPRNFLMQNLLSLKKSACEGEVGQQSPCEACNNPLATVYCSECQEKLCEACQEAHGRLKATRSHKTTKLEDLDDGKAVITSTVLCEKHAVKVLKFYCEDCSTPICSTCFIEDHNLHRCLDVNKVAEENRRHIGADSEATMAGLTQCNKMLDDLEQAKNDFLQTTGKVEAEICNKAEEMKLMIERHKQKLLDEVTSACKGTMKQFENAREQIKQHIEAVESLRKYSDQLMTEGSACDIVRAANSLRDRAEELLSLDNMEHTLQNLQLIDLTFSVSTAVENEMRTIGEVRLSSENPEIVKPTLTHTVQKGSKVCAVVALGKSLFLTSENEPHVEVYDVDSLQLKRQLKVAGLGKFPQGLAACAVNNCLYVSDRNNDTVYKIQLPNDDISYSDLQIRWTVAKGPRGLSLTRSHNLLVACLEVDIVQEYTPRGILVRDIGISDPYHAVQLSNGQILACQNVIGNVSMLRVDGMSTQICCSTKSKDWAVGQMTYPRSVCVSNGGFILVADGNNRIMLIDASLSDARQFPLSVDDGIRSPIGMWLDELHGRLYVTEYVATGRLLVFDNVVKIRRFW